MRDKTAAGGKQHKGPLLLFDPPQADGVIIMSRKATAQARLRLRFEVAHMSFDKLKAEALRLAPEARADLARELLASLDELSEAETERLWIDEAIHRDEELDSGAARAHPADEVLNRARARRK